MTGTEGGAASWLAPLLPGIPGLTASSSCQVTRFEDALRDLLADYPIGNSAGPQLRSQHLARIRRGLATSNQLGLAVPGARRWLRWPGGPPDTDAIRLRVSRRRPTRLDRTWPRPPDCPPRIPTGPRLVAASIARGELAGIAITEPRGGTQVHATTTAATEQHDGNWTVTGTKTWISRLNEASAFIAFFKNPAMQLTAAVVDAAAPGVDRNAIQPGGLSGWTWGELHLQDVHIQPSDILGGPGQGMLLLREHFAHYRPLVAATALGVAAAVHDLVAMQLSCAAGSGIYHPAKRQCPDYAGPFLRADQCWDARGPHRAATVRRRRQPRRGMGMRDQGIRGRRRQRRRVGSLAASRGRWMGGRFSAGESRS